MNVEIEKAIKLLAGKIAEDTKAGDALHYTQAVLNLAQADGLMANTKKNYSS